MNPYAILGAALLAIAAYGAGRWDGGRLKEGEQDRTKLAVEEAARAARESTAKAIASIKVQNTTIQQRLEKEVRREPVYRDCRITGEALNDLNEALTLSGTASPSVASQKASAQSAFRPSSSPAGY